MKICIIGFSGAGKSTLAANLAQKFNIPCLHLDNVHFNSDWTITTLDEENEIVKKFLDENENWIIDGRYFSICQERFEQCDLLIYLNFNRFYCYKMAKYRYKTYKTSKRDSFPCEEKFDFYFKMWVLFKGRTHSKKKKDRELITKYSNKSKVFKNRKELNAWFNSL